MQTGEKYFEMEELSPVEQYHDFLLTRLRTHEGVDKETIKNNWGMNFLKHFIQNSEKFLAGGKLIQSGDRIMLTRKGMFISDHIISELFIPT